MRDEEMLAEIEGFLEGFNQPTYRGMRKSIGSGCAPGQASRTGAGYRRARYVAITSNPSRNRPTASAYLVFTV
jgi:hypothetical protein